MSWAAVPLKHLAEIHVSNVDKRSVDGEQAVRLCNYTDVYYRDSIGPAQQFMSATASREQLKVFTLQRGDVIITKDSETPSDIGAAAFVGESAPDLVCGYHLAIIRPKTEAIDGRYLHWCMNSRWVRGQLASRATGVTRFGLRTEVIANTVVKMPPLREQRRVAHLLDVEVGAVDKAIAGYTRLLKLLEQRRRAEISQVIGDCSEGVVPFKYLLANRLSYGANEPANLPNPTEPRYVRITDVRTDGTLDPDTYRSLPKELAQPYLLQSGDLLLARSGATVGKSFLYDSERHDSPACFAGYLIRARVDPAIALPTFAYYWTQSHRYWHEVGLALVQATIQNVSAERYANFPFPRTKLEEQRQAVNRLDASAETLARLRAASTMQIDRLHERRDALITAAVTDQLEPTSYRASAIPG